MVVIGIVQFVDPSHKEALGMWVLFNGGCFILAVIVFWVCLEMYFLVCMYRFYKQVKSGIIASSKQRFEKENEICDF